MIICEEPPINAVEQEQRRMEEERVEKALLLASMYERSKIKLRADYMNTSRVETVRTLRKQLRTAIEAMEDAFVGKLFEFDC